MKNIFISLIIFALLGCEQSAEAPPESPSVTPDMSTNTGIVLESIQVESYTYIKADVQGEEVWIATQPLAVEKGDTIAFSGVNVMTDFYSKSLDQTFPSIMFAGYANLMGADQSSISLEPLLSTDMVNPHHNVNAKPATEKSQESIERLEGGKTVVEIITQREQYEGQEVTLRAVVIKFSPNILGKNWITLQDGTGDTPNDKLVVTSSESVEIGEEIVVTGIVKNNVDIGAGYSYDVILEGAVVRQ